MNFNINDVLADMLSAIKRSVGDNWDEVKSTAKQFLKNEKERLELIAELHISGELSQKKFEDRLLDNKVIVEAELNSLTVISKVMAQNAANAAIEVLDNAVKVAIKAAL